MQELLPDFSQLKVLVVGDVMLDRYWQGDTGRISPEAPVPVVKISQLQDKPGGAANVALNLAKLNCKTKLLGIIGADEAGRALQASLKTTLDCDFVTINDIKTITKLRVTSRQQQLIRLDFEDVIDKGCEALLSKYYQALPECDIVLLSDYAKGTLSTPEHFINKAIALGKKVVIDPKAKCFSKYANASLITPNLKEFEEMVGKSKNNNEMAKKAYALINKHNIKALLVTLGPDGMLLVNEQYKEGLHIASYAKEVFDVTGAGDTVIACMAASMAKDLPMSQAMKIANTAAAIVIGKMGTAFVSPDEIKNVLHKTDTNNKIVSEENLKAKVDEYKQHGLKVVMTNGCFDILHFGHIKYLSSAKSLGDKLIIAVNTDESVRKLKGSNRPVNDLQARMSMLAALEIVDHVVAFGEETPQRLYADILPDMLVKGGDYKAQDLAGYDEIIASGGEVKVLEFVPGFSTTSTLERLQN